jgi:Zn-dependent alcohol dehydrogenase
MDVRAAIAVVAGKPLEISTIQLEGPREGRSAGRNQGHRCLPHR